MGSMNGFLILVAPPLVVLAAVVTLFIWGARKA